MTLPAPEPPDVPDEFSRVSGREQAARALALAALDGSGLPSRQLAEIDAFPSQRKRYP